MRFLLDTHTFLWMDASPDQLSETARSSIQDDANELLLSYASIWEMQIKVQLGKLMLAKPLRLLIAEQQQINRIQLLPITPEQIYFLEQLPSHHRDPFDRMIIAQSFVEQVPILGVDRIFETYGAAVVW
jgi:PIN domain nuclease of toxin-antitoxin system